MTNKLREIHPLARRGNCSGFINVIGKPSIKSGDRIIVEGRHGWLDEALSDGDAFVSFDDGSHETLKWRQIRHPAPFIVGETYQRLDGKFVTIIGESTTKGYECVQGDDPSENSPDGVWRYNRACDRGRVTASAFDMTDPRNLIPREE